VNLTSDDALLKISVHEMCYNISVMRSLNVNKYVTGCVTVLYEHIAIIITFS
jgi:hypothetical protein